jgi:hypothetical protein
VSMHTVWERSKGWRRSWVFTGAWCAKHWRTRFPGNERLLFDRKKANSELRIPSSKDEDNQMFSVKN